jgi:hypothetical protein
VRSEKNTEVMFGKFYKMPKSLPRHIMLASSSSSSSSSSSW